MLRLKVKYEAERRYDQYLIFLFTVDSHYLLGNKRTARYSFIFQIKIPKYLLTHFLSQI